MMEVPYSTKLLLTILHLIGRLFQNFVLLKREKGPFSNPPVFRTPIPSYQKGTDLVLPRSVHPRYVLLVLNPSRSNKVNSFQNEQYLET